MGTMAPAPAPMPMMEPPQPQGNEVRLARTGRERKTDKQATLTKVFGGITGEQKSENHA